MLEFDKIQIPSGLLDAPTAMIEATQEQWESRFGCPHYSEEDMDPGVPVPAVAWCVRMGALEVFIEHYFDLGDTVLYIRGGDVGQFLELAQLAGAPARLAERF